MNSLESIAWDELGDLACEILAVSLNNKRSLEQKATEKGGTFEGLVAAAITEAFRERIEQLLAE